MTDDAAEAPDIPAHPDKVQIYSSPLMAERRSRLLKETRRLLNERGLKGFSIREVCRRADVAQRTLYNAFHNKDRLIGLSIREAYDAFALRLEYSTDPDTLEGVIHRVITINRGNLNARHYAEAIVTIYFAPDTPDDLWNLLQDMSVPHMALWFRNLRNRDMLEPWADADSISVHMANMQYGAIRDWVAGRLTDDGYLFRVVEATLLSVIAVTKDAVASEARAYLDEMQKTGAIPNFPKALIKGNGPLVT